MIKVVELEFMLISYNSHVQTFIFKSFTYRGIFQLLWVCISHGHMAKMVEFEFMQINNI